LSLNWGGKELVCKNHLGECEGKGKRKEKRGLVWSI